MPATKQKKKDMRSYMVKTSHPSEAINQPSVKTMSLVANIDQISSTVHLLIRQLMLVYLEEVLYKSFIVTEYKQQKTISKEDIMLALHNVDQSFKLSKYYHGNLDASDFNRCTKDVMQKTAINRHGSCLYVSKEGFVRTLRRLMEDKKIEMKLSKEAALYFQLITEQFAIETLTRANIIAVNIARRNTVMLSDIVVVMDLLNISMDKLPKETKVMIQTEE